MSLTPRTLEIFDFIKNWIDKKGYSPTYAEICEGVGMKSKSNLRRFLEELETEELIKIDFYKARSIKLCSPTSLTFDDLADYCQKVCEQNKFSFNRLDNSFRIHVNPLTIFIMTIEKKFFINSYSIELPFYKMKEIIKNLYGKD